MNASRRGFRAAVILPVSIGAIAAAISMASPASACDDGCGPSWQQPGYQQPWQPADWDSSRWGQPWQSPPPQQWEPDWWWHADYYEARRVPRDQWGNLDPAYAGVTIRFSGRIGTDYFVCDRPGWRLEERGSKVYYVSDYWNH